MPASARVVAFVGNGFARKGLGFLIETWPLVAGGAFLLVAGSDRQTEKFVRRAHALNVGARVVFTGPQPNVEQIFHAADSFAMPSLFEPFGNVVMEAMACGLPAMTSAFSGVAEVIPPSMRGFRVENPDDVGEVALRLGALFDAPASLAADARATAEKFTWSRYAKELNADRVDHIGGQPFLSPLFHGRGGWMQRGRWVRVSRLKQQAGKDRTSTRPARQTSRGRPPAAAPRVRFARCPRA